MYSSDLQEMEKGFKTNTGHPTRVKSILVFERQIQVYFYPLKIFHLVRISDRNLPFRKFQPEKRLPKIISDLFRVKIRLK